MDRTEYINRIAAAYLAAWRKRWPRQKPIPYVHPTKRDLEAMNVLANEKVPLRVVLEAINTGAETHRRTYPTAKRAPAFQYFAAIARAKMNTRPHDPAKRKRECVTVPETTLGYYASVAAQLRSSAPKLPPEGAQITLDTAALIEHLAEELSVKAISPDQYMKSLRRAEIRFRRTVAESVAEADNRIIYARHANDAAFEAATPEDALRRLAEKLNLPLWWGEE